MSENRQRMSVAQFRALTTKSAKYSNQKNVIDGIRFDSRLEAKRYVQLKQLKSAGVVRWFTMQVPFRLPGGLTYRADFVVVWHPDAPEEFAGDSELVTIEDCKGFLTRVSINKIKQVEEIYGVTIRLIRKESR